MRIQRIVQCLVVFSLFMGSCHALVHAQQLPTLPHAFYGTVEINGTPAPAGTKVEARGTGVLIGIGGNPLVTTQVGRYGGAGGFDPKLVVQGSVKEGTVIEFYVNGVRAQCAEPGGQWLDGYPFKSGGITELNLRARPSVMPTDQATPAATPTVAPPSPTSQATPAATPTVAPPSPTSQATPAATPTVAPPSPTSQATPAATPTVAPPSPTSQVIPAATATEVAASPTSQSTLVPRATVSSTSATPSEPTLAPTLTTAATQLVNQTVAALIGAPTPTPAQKSPSGSSRGLCIGLVVMAVAIGVVLIVTARRRKSI